MSFEWDAIVIGAGIGGLSCATLLSRNGMKVLVLERHDKVGGYAHQFVRRAGKDIEYRFDVAHHNTNGLREGGRFRAIMEEMGVFDKLKIRHLDEVITLKFPDFEITIPPSVSLFRESLVELFPKHKDGIDKLFATMKSFYEETSAVREEGRFDEVARGSLLMEYPTISKYMTASIEEFVAEHVQHPKIAATIYLMSIFLGAKPKRFSALWYFPWLYEVLEQGQDHIQGGGYAYTLAMRDAIKSYGGEVLTKTEVERILVERGKCVGVKTKKGDRFDAPVIVCNAPAPVAFEKLIDSSVVNPDYLHQALKSEISLSAIKAFLGLKGTPSEIGFEKNDYVVVGSYDMDSEFDRFIADDFAGGAFTVSNNTVINPGDTPEGRTIIQWGTVADGKNWCRLPKETYKNKKADLTEVIIKRISEVIPDIRDRIEVIEVGTPHTMERYTLNPNGAISGYALTSNQPPNLNPRTPVTGLFLAGAWTFPGPGFGGTTMSGANTARIILGK